MTWPPKPRNWGWAIKKSSYTALIDACALYPAPLRDFLVELAAGRLFRAKWTEQIHGEWIRNVLENRPDLTLAQLTRTKDLMNRAILDCEIQGFEELMAGLSLPDKGDHHVLAAAIHGSCDAIVTFNLKDFPADYLAKYQLEVIHPDDFIFHQFGPNTAAVLVAAQRCRARLKNPPRTAEEYLDTLEKQGLPKTVAELRKYAAVI
ncbi:MAG: PIN domain-containing protein [Mesorhizobium sp.]|uniref:PIN domain-containing protein n=1 Tax=Mesorhizobium sp. TaxID=1871066 RepID=UPI0011FEC44D|nr:PIN domain-containing protein [Mesorhizobium sp.]TIS88758.1 MAG: PIN domain-containing protein [Mesorhizobium sp.]TJW06783.1 MAG: PIN domain-containing protein [Mesorhizobium sp.]TJW47835.1 MAG: PIN domain-containing protein [Mesorhizobium sp.]